MVVEAGLFYSPLSQVLAPRERLVAWSMRR
jgi:hypothetical protein